MEGGDESLSVYDLTAAPIVSDRLSSGFDQNPAPTVPSMATGIASRHHPTTHLGLDSRYAQMWTAAILVAAAVWIVIAILQSPRMPLLGMVAGLGGLGGIPFVRAPGWSAEARRQYAVGALIVAVVVLVIIGIGHHPEAGLTVVAVLACSSPHVIRWIAGA